jgi:hypothetical protein
MFVRPINLIALLLVLAVSDSYAAAGETRAQYFARQYLSGLGAHGYTMTAIQESYVTATFPGIAFFAVIFPQYPVSVEPPDGLNPSDVLAVLGDQVLALTGPDDLKNLFMTTLTAVEDPDTAVDAGETWLRLTEVFSQDGYFTFSDPDVVLLKGEVEREIVLGAIEVTSGGAGRIHVAMEFDGAGQLMDVTEVREVQAGNRPIYTTATLPAAVTSR